MSSMASFCAFFPRDVFVEIWDLIESVSEGFPTFSYITCSLLERRLLDTTCSPVAGDVYDGVFLCCPLSHKMS